MVAFMGLIIFNTACSDVFEPDIKNDHVLLISPSNNIHSKISTQTFMWQKVDGAKAYNFQLVSTSFDSIEDFVLNADTVSTVMVVNLYPGKFQWRVKAYNNGYETPYSTFSLQIDSSLDISKNTVTLINPNDGIYTKDTLINFEWDQMFSADKYILEIRKDSKADTIFATDTTAKTTINHLLKEGIYYWTVKAFNSQTTSLGSTARLLTIDHTSPTAPTLLFPETDTAFINDTLNFSWSRTDNSLNISCDSIFIFTSNAAYATQTPLKNDISKSLSYSAIFKSKGYYKWEVKTVDKAGNSSLPSEMRNFQRK